MFLETKREGEVRADPFSPATLIAWLERQPADSTYDYENTCGACLFGQYMAFHGIPWSLAEYGSFPFDWRCEIAHPGMGPHRISTFGDALKRARKFLACAE